MTAPGTWQILYGHQETPESIESAIIRELEEETALHPGALYSMNETLNFYDAHALALRIVPLFVAFVKEYSGLQLNLDEHSEFQWCSFDEARELLHWHSQKRMLDPLKELFMGRKPPIELELTLPRF